MSTAASHLVALGVPELITNTYQQYEELAIELAQGFQKRRAACGNADFCDAAKASRLAKLRARIEAARLTSHLFDSRRWWHDMKLSLRVRLILFFLLFFDKTIHLIMYLYFQMNADDAGRTQSQFRTSSFSVAAQPRLQSHSRDQRLYH